MGYAIIIIGLCCCVNIVVAKYGWDLMFKEGSPLAAKTAAGMMSLANLLIFCFNFYLLLGVIRS